MTCRNCGKEHIQRACRPQKLSPDKKGKGKGKGKVRSVEDGGGPEEEATGEAIAHETSETFMIMRSGSGTSGTESTPVVASVSPPSVGEGSQEHRCAALSPPGDSSLAC